MVIVMDMSSYEIELGIDEAKYGKEPLCSGWNPSMTQLRLQPLILTNDKRRAMPADLATVNVELFLQRI